MGVPLFFIDDFWRKNGPPIDDKPTVYQVMYRGTPLGDPPGGSPWGSLDGHVYTYYPCIGMVHPCTTTGPAKNGHFPWSIRDMTWVCHGYDMVIHHILPITRCTTWFLPYGSHHRLCILWPEIDLGNGKNDDNIGNAGKTYHGHITVHAYLSSISGTVGMHTYYPCTGMPQTMTSIMHDGVTTPGHAIGSIRYGQNRSVLHSDIMSWCNYSKLRWVSSFFTRKR